MTAGRTALVVGPAGAVGGPIVAALNRAGGWKVYGLSRSTPRDSNHGFTHVAADLLDANACRAALQGIDPPSHVFYAARAAHGEGGVEDVPANLAMLMNVAKAADARSDELRHIHLVEGAKWYGCHLGPYRTPAREDDPRHMPPNFYYDQQDALADFQRGKQWNWTASRPNVVCSFDASRARNLTTVIGAYAAICRELNVPMDFPGTRTGYETLTEVTDGDLLADGIFWMANEPRAANRAINISNGDIFRWSVMWSRLAAMWGIPCGEPRDAHLATWMADKDAVWQRIVAKYNLEPRRLSDVALWAFGDFVFRQDWDVISDTGLLRRLGFCGAVDSVAMWQTQFDAFADARILPRAAV